MVLRTWKLGEADRIVSLHTHDHGKVRGVAKGVRRTKSKFGARLEPLSHVTIQLYRGKGDLDTITQVETVDRFVSLRSDPDRFARAGTARIGRPGCARSRTRSGTARHAGPGLATLDQSDSPLVVAAFFLKLLDHEGVMPQLEACVSCGEDNPIVALDPVEGGVLCRDCRRGRPITPEALETLRRILGGGLRVCSRAGRSSYGEVDILATLLMEHHLERRLRAVAVLDQTQY